MAHGLPLSGWYNFSSLLTPRVLLDHRQISTSSVHCFGLITIVIKTKTVLQCRLWTPPPPSSTANSASSPNAGPWRVISRHSSGLRSWTGVRPGTSQLVRNRSHLPGPPRFLRFSVSSPNPITCGFPLLLYCIGFPPNSCIVLHHHEQCRRPSSCSPSAANFLGSQNNRPVNSRNAINTLSGEACVLEKGTNTDNFTLIYEHDRKEVRSSHRLMHRATNFRATLSRRRHRSAWGIRRADNLSL